jgi:hypothetical protein
MGEIIGAAALKFFDPKYLLTKPCHSLNASSSTAEKETSAPATDYHAKQPDCTTTESTGELDFALTT